MIHDSKMGNLALSKTDKKPTILQWSLEIQLDHRSADVLYIINYFKSIHIVLRMRL